MSEQINNVQDLFDCEDFGDMLEMIRDTHPAILGSLLNHIRTEVPKGHNSQQLAHPDFRYPLKRLVEDGNEQLRQMRKRIPGYLEGDPFLEVEESENDG